MFCLQHVFLEVAKTSFKEWSSRRIRRLKSLTDPSFWRRCQSLRDQFLDILKPKFHAPFKTGIQVVLKNTIVGSVCRLNIDSNMSSETPWRPHWKTGPQDVYEDLTLTEKSFLRPFSKGFKTSFLDVLQTKFDPSTKILWKVQRQSPIAMTILTSLKNCVLLRSLGSSLTENETGIVDLTNH